jgi:mono/diheme cytochrome c family protein
LLTSLAAGALLLTVVGMTAFRPGSPAPSPEAEIPSPPAHAASPPTTPAPEALAAKARDVLQTHCHRCHGRDGSNEGGFSYVLDAGKLVERRKVVAGEPGKSRLFKRITSGDNPMPPADELDRPTAEDVAVVKRWIEAGAPSFVPVEPDRDPLSPGQVIRLVHEDLQGQSPRERPFLRYLTLTHLYNAGATAEHMDTYRHCLSKLVNSLSWGRDVVAPRPIESARTIFRIDLRDYRWDEGLWEKMTAGCPYDRPGNEHLATCRAATGSRRPVLRGDWLASVVSRPPLYHDVLQLPLTDRELEALLRVDVATDVRQARAARAGFNGSGVSRNNRLIERHVSSFGAYWKSHDFAGNGGHKNLFAHPLDADADGGEIIFSLPNGLQGYMLIDGRGRRIDKGPTAIVSDPRSPDRAVENGLSCLSCHVRGMIDKADQVRDHALRNRTAFGPGELDQVLTLYPPAERFQALLREDADRFARALEKAGVPAGGPEPISALVQRYEAELDLPLAAAEAGLPAKELLRRIDLSPQLGRTLGTLKLPGGTVQRQAFAAAFAELAATIAPDRGPGGGIP